ncbi:hypothetical protein, partial [Hydrogenophaga sp.]|uniref:hypothetical protein n=1 Tax=Hydrogenophaga sp. TaxID=1904254 RepID=UPI002FC8DC45
AANPDTSQRAGCHDRCWAERAGWGCMPLTISPLRLPDDEPFQKSVAFNFGALCIFFSAA